jgi:hypothetical protein
MIMVSFEVNRSAKGMASRSGMSLMSSTAVSRNLLNQFV